MKRWPELPGVIYGTGGSIRVVEVEQPQGDDGDDCHGTWEPKTRTIEIEEGMDPRHTWHIFWHEWMHAVLADSGLVNLLTDDAQEALCDAIGTARVVEMAAGKHFRLR